jgi:hypothetical protein
MLTATLFVLIAAPIIGYAIGALIGDIGRAVMNSKR